MVVAQNVLDALKQIGLNLYERKLWVALLSRGSATAGELSSLAKVPHSRTYDVLESLAEKGFVVIQATKPLKYVAIAPNEALERAKSKLKEDFEVTTERIDNFKSSSALKELNKTYKKGVDLVEPAELTGSLKGRHAMHQQLDTLFKTAKNNISILTTSRGVLDLHSRHADLLKKMATKGVKVRIAAPHDKKTSTILGKLKSFADVKKIDKRDIAGRFSVIDDNHLVIALTDDDSVHPTQDVALWTQSEHIAGDVLGPMFDIIWEKLPRA